MRGATVSDFQTVLQMRPHKFSKYVIKKKQMIIFNEHVVNQFNSCFSVVDFSMFSFVWWTSFEYKYVENSVKQRAFYQYRVYTLYIIDFYVIFWRACAISNHNFHWAVIKHCMALDLYSNNSYHTFHQNMVKHSGVVRTLIYLPSLRICAHCTVCKLWFDCTVMVVVMMMVMMVHRCIYPIN